MTKAERIEARLIELRDGTIPKAELGLTELRVERDRLMVELVAEHGASMRRAAGLAGVTHAVVSRLCSPS